jgi:hypothetical protein
MDTEPHHLLAQVPLTVSPFLNLPTATTLPYTYKQLPSTLPYSVIDPPASNTSIGDPSADPNSATNSTMQQQKPAYVTTSAGHAAHPDDIIASCRALANHLDKMQEDAKAAVAKWENNIRERELAEKRRVAPGWLDEEVRMLVPEKKGGSQSQQQQGGSGDLMSGDAPPMQDPEEERRRKEGEELDRAFGGMQIR